MDSIVKKKPITFLPLALGQEIPSLLRVGFDVDADLAHPCRQCQIWVQASCVDSDLDTQPVDANLALQIPSGVHDDSCFCTMATYVV